MQRSLLPLLGALVLGCASSAPKVPASAHVHAPLAAAEELAGAGQSYALIFNGDSEERHQRNVSAAERALVANGLQKERIFVLNRGTATREHLSSTLTRLEHEITERDRLVVYFTGHGAPNAIVTGDGRTLTHDDVIDLFSGFRRIATVFVFDACYSGALPFRLVERGFRVHAMAPAADGEETQCQLFAPQFWSALERHLDLDGDGKGSFRESFAFAMRAYDAELRRMGHAPAHESYAEPISEASARDLRGPTLVMLSAEWCGACHAAIRELGVVQQLLGARVHIVTLDVDKNPLRQTLQHLAPGTEFNVLPALLFVSDGQVRESIAGARRSSEVIALIDSFLPKLDTTRESIARKLKTTLKSRDSEEVRFALVALSELDVVDAELVSAFERELRRPWDARLVEFVERLERSTGYRELYARLDARTRESIEQARARYAHDSVLKAVGKIRGRNADARASGWVALLELAKSGASQGALLSALPGVLELENDGDGTQRRMAELTFEELMSAIEGRGKPPIGFEFSGNRALGTTELSRTLYGQSLAMLIAWGHALIQREYGRRGFLNASVSKAELAFTPETGLRLRFLVTEGPQYFFRSLRVVEGKARRPLSVAYRAPALSSGPVDVIRLADVSNQVLERYRNAAHYLADIDMDYGCDELRLCDVVLRVEPGAQYRLGTVSFSGGAFDAQRYRATAAIPANARYADTLLSSAKKRLLQLPNVDSVVISTQRGGEGRVDVSFEINR